MLPPREFPYQPRPIQVLATVASPGASVRLVAAIGISDIHPIGKAGAIMVRYLIESPHTPEECLRALDEVLARGSEELARYDWGCMAGDHTGYAIVEAGSKAAVEATIPAFLQSKTRVVELNKFTPEQLSAFRQGL